MQTILRTSSSRPRDEASNATQRSLEERRANLKLLTAIAAEDDGRGSPPPRDEDEDEDDDLRSSTAGDSQVRLGSTREARTARRQNVCNAGSNAG